MVPEPEVQKESEVTKKIKEEKVKSLEVEKSEVDQSKNGWGQTLIYACLLTGAGLLGAFLFIKLKSR